MKRSTWITAIAAAAAMAVSIPLARGQDESSTSPQDIETLEAPQPIAVDGDCAECAGECATGVESPAAGRRHGRLHHRGGHLRGAWWANLSSSLHAPSPPHQHLIDPGARADWIAQQRAANQSWHAGYYHTEWGGPVALMVPPIARTQSRWGWGVAQTTVDPIYHQFDRPYPGPVGVSGGLMNPLQPTPRWPSHTDQFGIYYIRGPW